jgi:hypothetical protein
MRSFGTSVSAKKVMAYAHPIHSQHSGYAALYMLSPSRQTYRETDVNVMHTCRSILIESWNHNFLVWGLVLVKKSRHWPLNWRRLIRSFADLKRKQDCKFQFSIKFTFSWINPKCQVPGVDWLPPTALLPLTWAFYVCSAYCITKLTFFFKR